MEICNGIKFGSKLLIEISHQQIRATSRRKAFKIISRLIHENNSSQSKIKKFTKTFLADF